MRCILILVAAAFCSAVQADTKICDGIAAKIRNDAKITKSKENLLITLSSGDRPYIELAKIAEMQIPANPDENQKKAFLKKFRDNFYPSKELDKNLTSVIEGGESSSLLSIAGSYLHFIKTTGGTAHCESYLFFNTVDGGDSQMLPNIPTKYEDSDDPICGGWGDSGHLARIGGKDVFLEFITTKDSQTIRIVPLKDKRWASGCTIEVSRLNNKDIKVQESR